MSDLSTNTRSMVNNMDFQNHTNSRPKFQPIRVKELLHFCESDDDESEDKPQNSDTESDHDEPQLLPKDDGIEDVLNKSLSFHSETHNNELKTTCKVVHTFNSSRPEESLPVDNVLECKPDGKSSAILVHERGTKSETNVMHEKFNQVQLNIDARVQRNIFNAEHKSKHIINVDNKKQSNEESLHKSDSQSLDQQKLYGISNSEPTAFPFRDFENASQPGINNVKNTNIRSEIVELKLIVTEEKTHKESIPSTNKSLSSDAGSFVNSTDQWALQTPLKHSQINSTRPDPCFSRRNITQTPQNKLSDPSKNHGLTPATISSHRSQNSVRQTPLQNKSINFMDSIQTPKNSVYITPSMGRHETPRYLNIDGKLRKPLVDTTGFAQNDSSNRYLLQGSQLFKVNEVTPKLEKTLSSKNVNSKTSLPKQILETSENAVHTELDANEELKENKYPTIENASLEKETIVKLSNSKQISHCTNDSKETLKPVCSLFQNQQPEASNQNQQKELNKIADNVSNVQFSMPPNIPTSKQPKTVSVKGKEYLILGTLGQGMSGEVLRVQDVTSLELCAIKCVNLNRMDKDSAQGCLEEISMLHKLQAPCVVKMFDYEIKFPMVYVVMEMGDTDLSRLLKTMSQEKQIPLTMILYYWTEMLTAVKHIHDNGVIHSDLKPANFLLVRGRLKLIDFGIASSMNADMTSVVKHCPIGTLNYISPEALMDIGGNSDSPTRNDKYKISFKSDVWSLGCILYSLVYGHTPFHHIRSQWAKVNAITNPKPNIRFPTILPSADGNKHISSPPILIDVMRKCLQHDPKARPTVAELLQVEYIPTKQEQIFTIPPEVSANTLLKIKHALNENEWRQLLSILESRRYTSNYSD